MTLTITISSKKAKHLDNKTHCGQQKEHYYLKQKQMKNKKHSNLFN